MGPRVIKARAPVRVDPAGGGTDAPPFCVEYGGAVVNFSQARYATARLEVRPGTREAILCSRDFDMEVRAERAGDLAIDGTLDFLKAVARRMDPPWGFRLTVDSDVEPGTGLGSSGAVGVACVAAFRAALETPLSQGDTAKLANDIERTDLGHPGGNQDSYGAALGGINLLTYHQGGGTSFRPVAAPVDLLFELEHRGFLVYTGDVHLSGSIHRDIKESYALPNSPTVDALQNLARIATKSVTALERGDLNRFGELLSDNWTHHQRLHPSCNSPRLQAFYQATRDLVVGGKTCGAGGGGYILFLAHDGKQHQAKAACRELGGQVESVRIDQHGLVTWTCPSTHGRRP